MCKGNVIMGADLHKKFVQFHAINKGSGEIIKRKVPTDEDAIRAFFCQFDDQISLAVESTFNWYWFVDLLQELGIEVFLSNPQQTKVITKARVKNDKVDAKMLALLLSADLLPTCWIPPQPDRHFREVIRYRMRLVQRRTGIRNTITSYLSKQNVKVPFSSTWTKKGRKWLESSQLKPPHDEMAVRYLELEKIITSQIEQVEKQILESYRQTDGLNILRGIPGCGLIAGLTVITESGPIDRFPSCKQYCAFSGLVPKTRESGGKSWRSGLCKQANMVLKWTFIEIATSSIRSEFVFKNYYHRMLKRKGKSTAKVALARKICKMVYHMLRRNMSYDEYVAYLNKRRLSRVSS